jgi:hypothetical protein
LTIVSSLSGASGPAATDWRFAHPGASIVAGVNVRALLASELVRSAAAQAAAHPDARGFKLADLQRVMAVLSEIDTIALSLRSQGNKGDGLALVTGRFEGGAMKQLIEQSAPAVRPRMIAPGVLLVGETASVEEALVRMQPGAAPRGLANDARRMSAEQDVFVVGSTAGLPALPQGGASMAAGLKEFSFGLKIGPQPAMQLDLNTASAADAERMFGAYLKAREDLAKLPKGAQELDALARSVQVERAGETGLRFRFAGAFPARMPADAVALSGGPVQALMEMLTQMRPATAPRQEKVIIHGLDEGPREVVLK